MREAMDLITNRVPCVTFELATSSSLNFVTIINYADCSSDLGMKGGEQYIYLNLGVFDMPNPNCILSISIFCKNSHINIDIFKNVLLSILIFPEWPYHNQYFAKIPTLINININIFKNVLMLILIF